MNKEDWIDVKDKLPEEGVLVLVWNIKTNSPIVAKWKVTFWSSSLINLKAKYVSHWTALVTPTGRPIAKMNPNVTFTTRDSQNT